MTSLPTGSSTPGTLMTNIPPGLLGAYCKILDDLQAWDVFSLGMEAFTSAASGSKLLKGWHSLHVKDPGSTRAKFYVRRVHDEVQARIYRSPGALKLLSEPSCVSEVCE